MNALTRHVALTFVLDALHRMCPCSLEQQLKDALSQLTQLTSKLDCLEAELQDSKSIPMSHSSVQHSFVCPACHGCHGLV